MPNSLPNNYFFDLSINKKYTVCEENSSDASSHRKLNNGRVLNSFFERETPEQSAKQERNSVWGWSGEEESWGTQHQPEECIKEWPLNNFVYYKVG
jgi:hypothetical protein